MDEKQIKGITRRVNEVDDFLNSAKRVWTGRIISSSYGVYGEKILCMEMDLKNKVLEVVELYNEELRERLEKESDQWTFCLLCAIDGRNKNGKNYEKNWKFYRFCW